MRCHIFWNLNSVYVNDKKSSITGWALPYSGIVDGTKIIVNGHTLNNAIFREEEEVAKVYPWWPNARRSSFSIDVSPQELELFNDEELVFEAVPVSEKEIEYSKKTVLYFRPNDLTSNFPEDVIQNRIGSSNSFQFSMSGLTLARHFRRVFEEYSEQKWLDNELIVDWGCGSGRVSRHIIRELSPDQHFMGFDIDKSATDWANVNIAPFFKHSMINPPLHIDSHSADIMLAYSVLTHLALDDMRKWIKEAARVLKKGGYFIFTILSDTAIIGLMPYAETSLVVKFHDTGFNDTQENDQLETTGVSGDYYRNV